MVMYFMTVSLANFMSKFIAQKEMVCCGCYREIQKGEWVYENCWEDIFCESCEDVEKN
jgi:hypothetical protein